jgi:CRISPR/Cas system CMR subunit Cmr6 (Cas7 group RAMP superfamily)
MTMEDLEENDELKLPPLENSKISEINKFINDLSKKKDQIILFYLKKKNYIINFFFLKLKKKKLFLFFKEN